MSFPFLRKHWWKFSRGGAESVNHSGGVHSLAVSRLPIRERGRSFVFSGTSVSPSDVLKFPVYKPFNLPGQSVKSLKLYVYAVRSYYKHVGYEWKSW